MPGAPTVGKEKAFGFAHIIQKCIKMVIAEKENYLVKWRITITTPTNKLCTPPKLQQQYPPQYSLPLQPTAQLSLHDYIGNCFNKQNINPFARDDLSPQQEDHDTGAP